MSASMMMIVEGRLTEAGYGVKETDESERGFFDGAARMAHDGAIKFVLEVTKRCQPHPQVSYLIGMDQRVLDLIVVGPDAKKILAIVEQVYEGG